ncbi:MAG: hypothetical protein ACKVP4_05420 [Hyphomicrobium sp.]
MWRIWVFLGSAVWLATIAASGAINYLAGYQFGRSPEEAQAFAILGVAADAWKAVGPIFIVTLWRGERRLASCLATAVWVACFAFAVFAALGLAAQNRSAVTGGREAVKFSYEAVNKELSEVERRRERIGATFSPAEIQSAIDAVSARATGGRGTVASLSDNCGKDNWRTRNTCAEVAKLRQKLATAREAQRLDERIVELNGEAKRLRGQGGSLESDPQAQLISRLSFGYIAPGDVGLGIVLLLVIMIELISAFAPVVLNEAAAVHRTACEPVAAGRDQSRADAAHRDGAAPLRPIGDIFEYLCGQIIPDARGSVSAQALFSDYVHWCAACGFSVLDEKLFFTSFDTIVENDLGGNVQRQGSDYFGLRLLAIRSSIAPPGRVRRVRRQNSL